MSTTISVDTAMQLFDKSVTVAYQNDQYLMDTVTDRHGTTGIATNVPVSDIIEMNLSTFAPGNIPITPVSETNVQVLPYNYYVKTVINGGERTLFAYDDITNHSVIHGLAGRRLEDFIKINAIYSSGSFGSLYTVPVTVGVNTGLNEGKIADALAQLESNGVNVANHSCSLWVPARCKPGFYDDERVVNFFYNDKKPLTDNMIKSYLDTDVRFLGAVGINQIPFTTSDSINTYLIPLVHRAALVQIYNRSVSTSITWVEQEDRWELLTKVTTGANIIQANGIALITANDPFAANA